MQTQNLLANTIGRLNRRYIVVIVFSAVALLLWIGLPDGYAIPRPSFHHDGGYKYIPSSYDWGKAKVFHPVKDMMSPPQGKPQSFPKVQSRSKAAGKDPKADALAASVRKAFDKSWKAYKDYAWAKDELLPISLQSKVSLSGWMAQLVDALDLLWIMDLKDEFHQAVKEVATIDWSKADSSNVDVFEVTIRYLGGLVAAYDLSQEKVLLDKAVELGNTLYAVFDTPNRMPARRLIYEKAMNGQLLPETASGAFGGSLCLEFTRLSQITGDPKYYDATERIKQFFYRTQNETKLPGLWPQRMDYRNQAVDGLDFSLGAGADSQYEYYPKMDALLGGLDPQYKHMTIQSLETARDNLMFRPMTEKDADIRVMGKVKIVGDNKLEHNRQLEHLSCFSGGMYGLAGKLLSRDDFAQLAIKLTNGCVWAYDSTPTNVMPETSDLVACEKIDGPCPYVDTKMENTLDSSVPKGFEHVGDHRYILRPEAIESVFYIWRITGDNVWREAAGRMWEGINKEAETEKAYGSITNVLKPGEGNEDTMETFWIAETLKYFYLTFVDESIINLDEWVLNTEAHPFKRPV